MNRCVSNVGIVLSFSGVARAASRQRSFLVLLLSLVLSAALKCCRHSQQSVGMCSVRRDAWRKLEIGNDFLVGHQHVLCETRMYTNGCTAQMYPVG